MDKLEKHIGKNRKELDRVDSADFNRIWQRIQPRLELIDSEAESLKDTMPPIRRPKVFNMWSLAVAASVALLIGVGVGYLMRPAEQVESKEFNLADYAPELADEAANYSQLVEQKKHEINFTQVDTAAFSEIMQELKELDQEYQKWTEDVPQYIRKQELLDFLQRHYEQKIRVLEILSKEIEKKAHHEAREIRL